MNAPAAVSVCESVSAHCCTDWFYLQRELHVEVSCPQKLDEKAVGEAPGGGQLSGLQRSSPQGAYVRDELLTLVREFIKLRAAHVALCSGHISLPPAGCGEEEDEEDEGGVWE